MSNEASTENFISSGYFEMTVNRAYIYIFVITPSDNLSQHPLTLINVRKSQRESKGRRRRRRRNAKRFPYSAILRRSDLTKKEPPRGGIFLYVSLSPPSGYQQRRRKRRVFRSVSVFPERKKIAQILATYTAYVRNHRACIVPPSRARGIFPPLLSPGFLFLSSLERSLVSAERRRASSRIRHTSRVAERLLRAFQECICDARQSSEKKTGGERGGGREER